ncbi:MAG: hypothetical protein Q9188_005900 [Gyalolechia gomerana]
MAGVETAGVVLAALPIVVQVLKEYRSGLRRTLFLAGKSKVYENKVGKLARQLKILHTNLKQVLTRVIGTAAPDAWSGDVPGDYKNEIWTGEAGKRIRTYLEEVDAFDTFETIIEDFEDYLVDVTVSLSRLLPTPVADPRDLRALVDGHNNSGGHFGLQGRIEFVMKESRITTFVEELKSLSRSLESLVGNCDSIHHMKQLKATSEQSGYARTLYTVQRHAHAFFKALSATPTLQLSAQGSRSMLSTDLISTTPGDQLVPIRNMCRVLLEVGTRILLVSADSRLFRAARQNTTASLDAEGHDTLELNQFLLRQPNLSPVDKFRFGLSIASSLLQLNLTPWISKCWTKEDIVLRRERSADCGYDIARPLIRGRFEESTTCQRSDDNPEIALLELGILMVELWTEKTLESWLEDAGRANSDLSNLALRRGLLYEWWSELRKKAPPNYCQVVQICFFPGEFRDVDKSWDVYNSKRCTTRI